jgi:hypothetical protein
VRLSSPIAVNPARVPPKRIGTETPELEPQRNRLRNGLQGQLPVDHVILTVAAHTGRPERHRFVRVDLEEAGRAADNSPSGVGCHRWVVERPGLLRGSHHDDDCPRKAVPQGFSRVLR